MSWLKTLSKIKNLEHSLANFFFLFIEVFKVISSVDLHFPGSERKLAYRKKAFEILAMSEYWLPMYILNENSTTIKCLNKEAVSHYLQI